ncbi:MAG: hypothetical protein R3C13_06505 [Hyphomonas sp.]|uniref:hypothetical protein n=1 Tax=Hyphomonas sp. TaxID=87 RepID=UPI003528A767
MLAAEIVRLSLHHIDIKIISGERMHVLQWRRNLLWDEVLLDGKRQASSHGLWGREKVYGLVFGRDEEGRGGTQVMFLIDPATDHNWTNGDQRVKGVRLESRDGPLCAFGTLDPRTLEKPATFTDWMKKNMGMEWGDDRRPN